MKILAGMTVLDLGSFITAPYCAMLLADLGAQVIKIERPGTGDPFRGFKGGLYSGPYQGYNRNKRSLTLDFTKPAGRDVLDRLVRAADALIINVRPGVDERIGVDWPRLQALNPRLVCCAITGFGASGPYADRPAYDGVGQTLSGWLSMFHRGTDARIAGPAVSDSFTGLYATIGVLGALLERATTGVGRKVEVSMLEATIAAAAEPLGNMSAGEPPTFYSRAAASQAYIVTCADGKRLALHMSSPAKFWEGLAHAIDRLDLLEHYPDRQSRVVHYETIAEELGRTFATRPREAWIPLLERHDVPFAPERRLDELADDPQVQHLDVFYEMMHATLGKVTGPRRPIRFDGDNRSDFSPPPALGEHTNEVLREIGLTDDAIAALRRDGLI